MTDFHVQPIPASRTLEFRRTILRPDEPPEASCYRLDDHPLAFHLGAFDDGALIAVGSFFPEAEDGAVAPQAWRIRGMATLEERRGEGAGARILGHALSRIAAEPAAERVWCNGRRAALGVYERAGFQPAQDGHSDVHLRLHLALDALSRRTRRAAAMRGVGGEFPPFVRHLPQIDLGVPGCTARVSRGEALTVYAEFAQECEVPEHAHKGQWGIVIAGGMELRRNGGREIYGPGDNYIIATDEPHGARIYAGTLLIEQFEERDRY